LQIDSSLEAINRIAQTTTFQGRKLLDGSLDFISSAGSIPSVSDVNIDQANLGSTGQIDVEVVISEGAQQAAVTAGPSSFSASARATASAANARSFNVLVGGQTISVTTPAGYTSTTIVDNPSGGAGTVSYNATTGVVTLTANYAGNQANAQTIQAAFNNLTDFFATGATAPGTGTNGGVSGTQAVQPLLSVTANNSGAAYNNVSIEFVDGGSAANSANYDSEQKVLTVTYNSTAPQTAAALAAVINAATVDGAAPASALFSASSLPNGYFDTSAPIESLNTGNTGGQVLLDDLVFQLNGAEGAETFNFAAGTSASQIASAINLVSDSTGVSANYIPSLGLTLRSTAYGSNALVNVDVITEGASGGFGSSLSAFRSVGQDLVATVNGVEASGDANTLSINTSTLDLSLTVEPGSDDNFSFSITGGGALFQLGPDVTTNQQARLGIGSVSTGQLGGATGRLYELGSGQAKSLTNDVTGAAKIIDEVISKVTSLRGRLGAFQSTTLDSNLVSLNETLSNLQEAESSIRDADFAQESANLTRAQILVQSGTNVLSLANQNPQNVLSLLR
jgi:flagellin